MSILRASHSSHNPAPARLAAGFVCSFVSLWLQRVTETEPKANGAGDSSTGFSGNRASRGKLLIRLAKMGQLDVARDVALNQTLEGMIQDLQTLNQKVNAQ